MAQKQLKLCINENIRSTDERAPFCSFYIISCFVFVAVCFYIFWRRIFQLQCTTGGRWVRAEQTQRILRRSRQAFSKHDRQFQISPIICESVRFVASYSRSNLDLWSRPKIWMTYMDIMNWTAARENTSTHMRSTKNCLKYVLLKKFNVRINLIVCITLPLHWIPLHCVKHRRHSSSAFLSKRKTSPLILNRAVSLKNSLLSEAKFIRGCS